MRGRDVVRPQNAAAGYCPQLTQSSFPTSIARMTITVMYTLRHSIVHMRGFGMVRTEDQPLLGQAAQLVQGSGLTPVGKGERLLDRIHRVLAKAGMLERSGGVFLCAEAALCKSDTYFIGLNPGGSDDEDDPLYTVSESLSSTRLAVNGLDQDWSSRTKTYEPGLAPMQKRFKYIAEFLGLSYGAIPVANLVFTRSRSVDAHNNFGNYILYLAAGLLHKIGHGHEHHQPDLPRRSEGTSPH